MASSINNDAVQGETFLPGQIFVFGGFALRANSLGHLEQIENFIPCPDGTFLGVEGKLGNTDM